ncbi:sulfur reduction protein DsrS [Rhabdochromatium marinum]|uniref:sulfur reduction protein DsrS n=1 Tax=Rhabdochromatium marinum TaxID=48729 RepID=UPI00190853D4|nr:sulfur reduction protein DsrS [Rhabdochromatium marinum]MBK1647997.1 sulfur reduction protein DsrS [Rhabdochromatium marinum]
MELSSEDSLRLNVLLANKPQAIRIDEAKFMVHGLAEQGEFSVPLHPSGRPESYLRAVRELISGHILGSPGGYPIYLRRWTRMGQMREQSLEPLLMLGEPEAVVAAVCSPGLTEELARRAWWAMEDADNARHMLAHDSIVASPFGTELAEYLIDFLPFETDSDPIMDSVQRVLQPGLISAEQRLDLWHKSARKPACLVGFLRARPDDLPEPLAPRAMADELQQLLALAVQAGEPSASLLLRCSSGVGQRFLDTLSRVLAKAPNQEVLMATLDVMHAYFASLRPEGDPGLTITELQAEAEQFAQAASQHGALANALEQRPQLHAELVALRLLSGVSYATLRPLLPDPTTLGTLMRRKLAPVMEPLQAAIADLRA